MEAFNAYQMFIALQQHFGGDYDYFLYLGKTSTTIESFQRRKDKYHFHKLVRKHTDLESFFVANFVYGEVKWIGDLMTKEADDNFKRWLKINNAITKIFKDDLDYIIDHQLMVDDIKDIQENQNPKLLTAVYQNIITIESLLLLDEVMVRKTGHSFINHWNTVVGDPVVWPQFYKKLVKYRPWIQKLDINKFAMIVKDKLNEKK